MKEKNGKASFEVLIDAQFKSVVQMDKLAEQIWSFGEIVWFSLQKAEKANCPETSPFFSDGFQFFVIFLKYVKKFMR